MMAKIKAMFIKNLKITPFGGFLLFKHRDLFFYFLSFYEFINIIKKFILKQIRIMFVCILAIFSLFKPVIYKFPKVRDVFHCTLEKVCNYFIYLLLKMIILFLGIFFFVFGYELFNSINCEPYVQFELQNLDGSTSNSVESAESTESEKVSLKQSEFALEKVSQQNYTGLFMFVGTLCLCLLFNAAGGSGDGGNVLSAILDSIPSLNDFQGMDVRDYSISPSVETTINQPNIPEIPETVIEQEIQIPAEMWVNNLPLDYPQSQER